MLRRSNGPASSDEAPALTLDESQWHALLQGRPLQLTRREFRLLQALARHPGRIFTRAKLLELAYDAGDDVTERAVDSHVKNLRRKMTAATPAREWIRSVYGVGFSLDPAPVD